MKYKLIKTYPGSPPLDTVIYFKHNGFWYADSDREFTAFGCSHVLDYPEFWQPESEWKIKSKVIESEIGSLHWLNTLLDSYLRMGESLEKMDINPDVLPIWGDVLYRGSMEIMEYFKDKLK